MFKVMLVDDDYPVIEFLQQVIPWEEMDLSVIGAFTDGQSALEFAQTKEMPDIVLTDIGMPKMDGLELIAQLQKINTDVRCVILSCHDEFKFAQRAVKLGVNAYLLKETMEEETIGATLKDLIQSLRDEREKKDQLAYLKRLALQEQRTIFSSLNDSEYQAQFVRYFGIDFDRHAYVPVLMSVDDHRQARQRFQTDEVLLYAVQNITQEVACRERTGVVSFRHSPIGVVLLIPDDQPIVHLLRSIQRRLRRFLKETVSCLTGERCRSGDEFNETLRQFITSSADQRFYLRHHSIAAMNEELPCCSGDELFAQYGSAYEELYRVILSEDVAAMKQVLQARVEEIREKRYRSEAVKEWFLKMLLDIQSKAASVPFSHDSHRLDTNDILHTIIDRINSLDELEAFACHFMKEMMVFIGDLYEQSQKSEVIKAKQYVFKHLDKKITQEEVARMLHFNTSYFSRLFKKETGKNFSQYVMSMKMERAKDYLRTSNKTVDDISLALGYENKGYFFKLFKRYTGMTPAQYAGKERLS